MKILAIESSCDETSAAVVEKSGKKILVHSNITATSLQIHAETGGIIPENAAREQLKFIIPVITTALLESEGEKAEKIEKENYSRAKKILEEKIDAIAVTYGPGLIGSLLVGVETTKTLSFVFQKPLIPVNHLLAHLFANFISSKNNSYSLTPNSSFPFIGLIVSGGHTDLLYYKSLHEYTWLGGTRDDAAGEALDKIGRILGLSYPAGPEIEKRAKLGNKTSIRFHAPLLGVETYDFSFSGLKTEAARFIEKNRLTEDLKNDICFAVQKAVIDVLVRKTLNAAEEFKCQTILLGGGVSANNTLRKAFQSYIIDHKSYINIFSPEKKYCTDNAAMIGSHALLINNTVSWKKVSANPELYFA